MGKYAPLSQALIEAAARGQQTVELGFESIAELVGGLPASAVSRQWWANANHSQALAWQQAGYRVDQVYLDRKRVRFARTELGGASHGRAARQPSIPRPRKLPARRVPVGHPVDVRVSLQWYAGGPVTLDGVGKLAFPPLEAAPGLYRLTLPEGVTGGRPRIYIGETDNLHRRLA